MIVYRHDIQLDALSHGCACTRQKFIWCTSYSYVVAVLMVVTVFLLSISVYERSH